ncbi:MAG: PriCT-2 domain-containing protein, partial [Methylocella sp.]
MKHVNSVLVAFWHELPEDSPLWNEFPINVAVYPDKLAGFHDLWAEFLAKRKTTRLLHGAVTRDERPVDETKLFLRQVLPEEGNSWYCAAEQCKRTSGPRKGQSTFRHYFVKTIDELAERLKEIDGRKANAYYAIATFTDEAAEMCKGSGGYCGRRGALVQAIRDLPLDLDCGADKAAKGEGYATQDDALKAYRELIPAIGAPVPTLFVNSGGGVHTHLVFDKPLAVDEWKQYAQGYKSACLNAGLIIDPVVAGDAARVLRAPGTRNHKTATPRPVAFFVDGSHTVQPWSAIEPLKEVTRARQPGQPSGIDYNEVLAKLNPDDTEVVNFYRGALMAIPNTENVPADFWKKIGWKGQPPKDVPYDFWLHVGMALHSLGPKMWEAAFALWVEWSVQSRKHTDEELLNGWEHFSCDREQKINAGSLIRWAKAAGWQFPQNPPAAIQEILDAIAKTDICAIKAEMEADPKNAAKILIKRIVDVDIGALEEDELFRLAIKLSDIKARPLQRALKQARAKHAEEHRRRYETGETVNGRVRLFVDMSGPNETLAKVREILSSSKSGLYDRGAIITQLAKCEGATLAFEVSPDTLVRIVDEHCIPWTYTEAGDPHNCLFPRNYAVMYNQWLGQWDLPVLNGICSSPLIFEDGTVVCKEGYDEASGMYCEDVPNIEALIPSRPTKREAEEALMLIRKTFKTFCFADAPMVKDGNLMVVDLEKPPGLDESSFLCSLLTAVARASIWLTPGFLYRASPMSGAGTGKGKLARCNSIIAFGHQPIATSPGHSEEELDKRIIAALISGRPIIFLDNLNNRTLSSDTIASLLTDRPARVRVFGRNDKELPINSAALLIVTGNGVVLAEDICRRFVIVDFDARIENPESRPFDYDILEEVKTR